MSKQILLSGSLLVLSACTNDPALYPVCEGALTRGTTAPDAPTELGPTPSELVQALDGAFRVDYAALQQDTILAEEADPTLAQPALADLTLHFEPLPEPATWMRVDAPCDDYPAGWTEVEVAATVLGSSADLSFTGPVRLIFTGTTPAEARLHAADLPAETTNDALLDVLAGLPQPDPLTLDLFTGAPLAEGGGDGDRILALLKVGESPSSTKGHDVWNAVLVRVE